MPAQLGLVAGLDDQHHILLACTQWYRPQITRCHWCQVRQLVIHHHCLCTVTEEGVYPLQGMASDSIVFKFNKEAAMWYNILHFAVHHNIIQHFAVHHNNIHLVAILNTCYFHLLFVKY